MAGMLKLWAELATKGNLIKIALTIYPLVTLYSWRLIITRKSEFEIIFFKWSELALLLCPCRLLGY